MRESEAESGQIDQEWLTLMLLAKSYGFSKEQIRSFLRTICWEAQNEKKKERPCT